MHEDNNNNKLKLMLEVFKASSQQYEFFNQINTESRGLVSLAMEGNNLQAKNGIYYTKRIYLNDFFSKIVD